MLNSIPHHRALARRVLGCLALAVLSGCNLQLMNPQGDIGAQEKHLILLATGLMLLVVIPVIFLTLFFAWRYRETNIKATYAPKWSHSTAIEAVVWSIPCVIIVLLAVIIWRTTHALDPYKPIESRTPPVRVEVVALNWKWLFIYPDYGVASVNQLAIPVDTPVQFKLTADKIMNSFFIPQLGSQVYAMPGMQTQLHLIANQAGTYRGLSSAYSGSGFSDMHFQTLATSREDFNKWIAQARTAAKRLDKQSYEQLALDSHGYPVTVYNGFDESLFDDVTNKYMGGHGLAATMAQEVCIAPPAKDKLQTAKVE